MLIMLTIVQFFSHLKLLIYFFIYIYFDVSCAQKIILLFYPFVLFLNRFVLKWNIFQL